MTAIIENSEDLSLETRLNAITAMLKGASVDGISVVRNEVNNDIFIKNFLARNSSSIPDTSFVVDRLKRAPMPDL
ncbi:MAG: hypothetical protein QHG99_05465 [Methanomicrobiales archaeon]|nr:hypothetical protein [Methanomicrobiales archaeon]